MKTPGPTTIKQPLTRLLLILLMSFFLGLINFSFQPNPWPIDPRPYDKLFAKAEWQGPLNQRLAFCLLGYQNEERARSISVYEQTQSGWRRIFLDLDRGFHPWAIKVAELDGDPLPELAVGAYKTSRYSPSPMNRLLIFDWTEKDTLFPKWLGSRLGLPFLDFAFIPGAEGLDRLLTLEHSGEKRLVLRQYHWNGFGFTHDLDLIRVNNPKDFSIAQDRLLAEMHNLAPQGEKP